MLKHCAAWSAGAALFAAFLTAPVSAGQAGSGVVGGGLLVQEPPQGRRPSTEAQGAASRVDGRGRGAAPPIPRNAAGRVLLGTATPAEKGVWLPGPGITGVPIKPVEQLPMQPWARKVFEDRQIHEFEPHTRCKPSGVARQFQTPYGVEFVELTEAKRMYIFDIGGPHTFRTIYMDGRSHPINQPRTAYGHSIGWWDGDTFVVDTTNFHEGFWLDRKGLPHTEKLHVVERWTRTDYDTIEYEVMVDDPGAYTQPWSTKVNLRWEAGTELFEYVCQQANYAHELMVGGFETVDRATFVVP
jgi:hypothetical protein